MKVSEKSKKQLEWIAKQQHITPEMALSNLVECYFLNMCNIKEIEIKQNFKKKVKK